MMQVVPVWTVQYKYFASETPHTVRFNAMSLYEVLQAFSKINHGVNEIVWFTAVMEK